MSDKIKDSLLKFAREEIWSDPDSDKIWNLIPGQISTNRGALGWYYSPFINFPLPDNTNRYIVYSIGAHAKYNLGISISTLQVKWVSAEVLSNVERMSITPYIGDKVLMPSSVYFFRYLDQIYVALNLTDNRIFIESPNSNLRIRLYSNAYLKNYTEIDGVQEIYSGVIGRDFSANTFVEKLNDYSASPEKLMVFHNGVYTDNIIARGLAVGDRVHMHYDPSILDYQDVPVNTMGSFWSTKDVDTFKYIVTTPKDADRRDFWLQDIELFLCHNTTTNNEGWYLAKYPEKNVRQLTGVDYALYHQPITDLITDNGLTTTESFIRIYRRMTYKQNSVEQLDSMTDDLMMLSDSQRKTALSGLGDYPSLWSAGELENSGPMDFAFRSQLDLTNDDVDVTNVYNYYGIERVSQTCIRLNSAEWLVPYTMHNGGLFIFLSTEGLLIGHKLWLEGVYSERIMPRLDDVGAVLCFPGQNYSSLDSMDEVSSQTDDAVSDWYEERYYLKPNTDTWQLAVMGTDFSISEDGNVDWDDSHVLDTRIKRSASDFLMRDFTVDRNDVSKSFKMIRNDNTMPTTEKGLGRYYCYLNGHPLIETVDFVVEFPNVTIVNAEYLVDGDNDIVFIAHGCPGQYVEPFISFVKDNKLRHEGGFNLSLFRNKTFTIDGRYYPETDLVFDSGYKHPANTATILPSTVREGAIYASRSSIMVIGLSDLVEFSELRNEIISKDNLVKAALSDIYPPQDDKDYPYFIDDKHTVISYFMNALIKDILSGDLVIPRNLNITDIPALVNPYLSYLDKDITRIGLNLGYIEVVPHGIDGTMSLAYHVINFLHRVNLNYLNGRIAIRNFFISK